MFRGNIFLPTVKCRATQGRGPLSRTAKRHVSGLLVRLIPKLVARENPVKEHLQILVIPSTHSKILGHTKAFRTSLSVQVRRFGLALVGDIRYRGRLGPITMLT